MANEIVENAGIATVNGENLLGDKLFIDGVFDTVGLDGNKNLQSTEDEPVEAGIVCPRLGTTGAGTVTIDNVRYAGPLYPNITTASTDSSVVAVQGGSFRNAHQDILRDRIGVIDDSWFHNTTAGNRHGAALSLFDGSKTTITGSTFTNNSNTSGNGGAIGGSTASSIDSGGGSELTLQNCFFANNISTGQCGGAIYGSTNSQLTISGSTFTCNTANNYGGVIYATTRVELKISDSVFSGNIVTKGNGGAIHLEREVSATITGSTFSGNTAGVKTAGLGGAITVCFNSSLFVSGCTFAGNIAYNYAGAIFVNSEGKSTTIENCVFATKSDSIVIDTGTVSFSGTITLASDVRKENHPDRGHYLCSTDKVDFVFINEESISIAKLDNAENIRSLSFRSTEMVNFSDLELSDTILNIDCELPSLGQSLSIASGLTSLGSGTITVHGKNAVGGKAFFEGSLYKVYLSDNFLTITSEEYVRAAIVTSNGAEWVQVGSTNYAGNFYPSIDAALKQEDFVVMQGTFTTRSSVTGANKRAVISQTDVTGNAVDVDGGALMISEGFASITASAFSRNVARNGGVIANDEGRLIISGNTFTDNTAMQNGGAVYCATGGTGSVENALFTGNIAREAGGAVYCADAASALSISGSTFTDNASIQNGGAIYLKDGTVNITDCVFSATSDTIYNDDGVLTLGGTVWTAANITSTNAVSVEENTSLVLDLSVYAGTTSKELLTNFNAMFGTTQRDLTISLNVASDQANGTYVLAKGVGKLEKQNFTVTLNDDPQKSFNVSVGGATMYDGKNYTLSLANGTLLLGVEALSMGIVTKNGDTDTVVIGGVVYKGTPYAASDFATALQENVVIAAQNCVFSGGTGYFVENGSQVAIDGCVFSGNTSEFFGGALGFNEGTCTIRISGSTFSGNFAGQGGALGFSGASVEIENCLFDGNAAEGQGVVAAGAIAQRGGSLTLRNNRFATASDSVICSVGTNVVVGGTLTFASSFSSYEAVTVEKGSCFVLDLTHAADSAQFLQRYGETLEASQDNFSITVVVSPEMPRETRYILASGVNTFGEKPITITCGENSAEIISGGYVDFGDLRYELKQISSDLVLTVDSVPVPAGIVTPEGEATDIYIGVNRYVGKAYVTEALADAFAENMTVAMKGGTVSGKDAPVSILPEKTFVVDGCVFSGNAGAISNGGTTTVRNCSFLTAQDTIFNDFLGILTLGGTIWTAANIASSKEIKVESDTQLVLDLSAYAGGTEKELLTNFNIIFGITQKNLTISINAASDQETGNYVLATGAGMLSQQNFALTIDGDTPKHFNIAVGGTVEYDFKKYTLSLASGTLSFGVEKISDTAIVTVDGDTDTVVINGNTYTGDAYKQGQIGQAVADKLIVAAQNVTLSRFILPEGKTFVGDTVLMSGNGGVNQGGAIYNSGTATFSRCAFTENVANYGSAIYNEDTVTVSDTVFFGNTGLMGHGGAIYNERTATFTRSVFSDNKTDNAGGAIISHGTMVFSGCTFRGNTANTGGGAISNSGTATISDSLFSKNVAISNIGAHGGAIENSKTLIISGSTFSDNVTNDYGVIYSSEIAAFTDCLFIGNTAGKGGAIFSTHGTATISGCTFSNNKAKEGGALYNTGTATISNCVFSGNAADSDGAFYNSGTTTIRDCIFATATDSISNSFSSLTLGGTITTAANIFSYLALSVEENTSLVLDLSVYAGTTTKELLSDFNLLFGTSQSNLTISINVGNQQADGEYILARGVGTLKQQSFTITVGNDTQKNFTVSVDDAKVYDGKNYSLSLNNGTLSLSVDTLPSNTAVVTFDGSADTVVIDGVTYTGDAYKQADIRQAITDKKIIAAQDVSLATFSVYKGKTFIGDTVWMHNNTSSYGGAINNSSTATIYGSRFNDNRATDSGGAIYNFDKVTIYDSIFTGNTADFGGAVCSNAESRLTISGCTFSGNAAGTQGGALYIDERTNATIRNSVFATETDTIYNNGGTLALGGTIKTAANITSTKAISVEEKTSLVLDLSGYGGTTSQELLTNFDTMFGASQSDLAISLNVALDQTRGNYVLATGVGTLAQQNFVITVDNNAEKKFLVFVGGGMVYGPNYYSLKLADGTLSLTIRDPASAGVVTVNGGTDSVVIAGSTYTGDAYSQDMIGQALAEKQIVAAQNVTISGVSVSDGQTFVGDNITMSGVAAAIYSEGAMTFAGKITTGANITSTNAVAVADNTQLVLDLSIRTTEMGEMLTGFDTMFGVSRKNLSIMINVDQEQGTGVYALATNASLFDCPVMLDIESEKTTMLAEDRKFVYGGKAYQLVRENFSAALKIEDVSSGNIYGGKAIAENAELSLATGLMVDGSGVYAALIGGENISGGTVTKNGASFVDISGNIQATAAAGGVSATNCNVTMNAETGVAVADGNFSNIVCAGSIVNENTVLTVNADSALTISGGTFANAVAGGNYIQKEGGTVYGGRGAKASNTYVNITGGTFQRDIFGGNIAAKNSFATKINSYVTGSTHITIDTSENVVSIGGNLVAGSSGLGAIIDSTNLTVTGNAENLVFGEKSIVCGDSHDATTAVRCVGGSRNLTFDGFTGQLDAKVVGFDQVSLVGGSVTLAKSSRLSDVSGWNFSAGATLTFGDADNNFLGDRLSFGTFEENEWTVMTGDDLTLANWDWAKSVSIAGQNASFDEKLGCWLSDGYKFYKEDNSLKVAKLA